MAKSDPPMIGQPAPLQPPVVPAVNCTTCRYSGAQQGSPFAVCRKNPPIAAMVMSQSPLGAPVPSQIPLWPPVTQYDWCSLHAVRLN